MSSPSDSKPGTAVGGCMRISLLNFDLAAGAGGLLFKTCQQNPGSEKEGANENVQVKLSFTQWNGVFAI